MTTRSIRFEVRYPWGSSYCRKLRAALRQLGFATGSDMLLGASDSDGFLVAPGRQPLAAGQAIMRKMTDPDQTEDVLDQLRAMGVHEIFQDWKHLAWEMDAATLKTLGVQLRLVSRVRPEAENG